MATKSKQRISPNGLILKDQLISINRVTKVVKGGKNMSFAALVVIGDEAGHVGFGTGKAKEVPNAIKKAVEAAKNNLIRVPWVHPETNGHIDRFVELGEAELLDQLHRFRRLISRLFGNPGGCLAELLSVFRHVPPEAI